MGDFSFPVPLLPVENPRHYWSLVQSRQWRGPDRSLALLAVTGTDGKTTCAFALQQLLGDGCGRITTVDRQLGGGRPPIPSRGTTPDAEETFALLAAAREGGCSHVALELTSQALQQGRLWGLSVAGAIFSNLSPEHLDYHGTLENYFDSKLRLFDGRNGPEPDISAVCVDDPWGRKLYHFLLRSGRRVLSYGSGPDCDFRLLRCRPDGDRIAVEIAAGKELFSANLATLGRFNALNLLGALALSSRYLPINVLRERLKSFRLPPGRLETVPLAGRARAFLDYAHTAGALRSALTALREHFPDRPLGVLFGCGGGRDREKRPAMAAVAEALADYVLVTSDNPRREEPEAICREICAGFSRPAAHHTVPDRREAIRRGLAWAVRSEGVLLIAGKGHETEQIIGDASIPFSDGDVVAEWAERTPMGSTFPWTDGAADRTV
jgi:UDP-N-acetylmuramoyl-L-alanyl-D-glutamate--2,6-diaminopimelate ligase